MFNFDGKGRLDLGRGVRMGWQLGFGDGKKAVEYLGPENMDAFAFDGNRATWSRADGVTVSIDYKIENGVTRGTFAYSGAADVEEIVFPRLTMPYDPAVRLLTPFSQGRVLAKIHEYDEWMRENWLNGKFRAFQFTAALYGANGVYLDCRDAEYYNKNYLWGLDGDTLTGAAVFHVPLAGQTEFVMPYDCGAACFDGDWYEAALLYREWGRRQRWFTASSHRKNPLKNLSMWAWNRGAIDYVMPPVEQLARDCGTPVALDWYWWHHNPYDTDYPEFWPPREGVEQFKAAVARMNAQGIYTQVYTNGRTWDMDGDTFNSEGGADEIEIMRDGEPKAVAFNSYNHHRLGYMCGNSPKYQAKMEKLIGTLLDSGLPGVYLDMIGCTVGNDCYSTKHGHAPGGGNYHITGYREMVKRMRAARPEKLFSTEDCSEATMDLFDSAIILFATSSERMGDNNEFVPVFSMLYHGANALFGSYALPDAIPPWDELWPAADRWPAADEQDWNKLYPDQFFCELARDIVWGLQPMICNLQPRHRSDPRFAEVYKFIVDTAKFHHANVDLLYSGDMENPGQLECDRIAVEFMARGIFTHKEHLRIIKRELPAILHGVWQDGSGKFLILANYTGQSRKWRFGALAGELAPRSYQKVALPR